MSWLSREGPGLSGYDYVGRENISYGLVEPDCY
jgi:hypothetical protein